MDLCVLEIIFITFSPFVDEHLETGAKVGCHYQ